MDYTGQLSTKGVSPENLYFQNKYYFLRVQNELKKQRQEGRTHYIPSIVNKQKKHT